MTTINPKEYVTTDEAAKILGVSTQTIYKYEKEQKLTSLYDHKWRMRKTKLFKREDVELLKQKFDKPGLTTGEAAEQAGVTPATILTYIKKEQLPAFMKKYKGKDLYFIKQEDLNEFLSSKEFQIQEKKRERKQFYDKDKGYVLYQSLQTENGQLARILELDREGKVVTSDGESLNLQQAKEQGFTPVNGIVDHPYSTKRGYAKFRFVKPHNIVSNIYDIIEAFYQNAGPQNIRLNTEDEYIVMEVKPVSLPFTKEKDQSIINLIQHYLIEGKIIFDIEGIFIESDLEPFIIHIPSDMKEFIRKKASAENKSMEELAIQAFSHYWGI